MRHAGAPYLMLAVLLTAAARPSPAQSQATQTPATQTSATQSRPTTTPTPAPGARVEARSGDFLAVGTVRADQLTIHLSRLADNAPVRDAAVTVVLRGTSHAALAASDGGYTIRTADLTVPGPAAVLIEVTQGALREQLSGTLEIGGAEKAHETRDSLRQTAWWVLNFAVCIGFLMLWNRRRKKADP
ncbi:MAG TPA: hypothetical protein VKT22_15360 [Steroidobacteraceae bacterium]|nr:hypothetical protein [Steroidobacteraceae bacterium]